MMTNHTAMIGPNNVPTAPVPNCCSRNSATSTASEIGTTSEARPGEATCSPATADSTEIAGVIMPSP